MPYDSAHENYDFYNDFHKEEKTVKVTTNQQAKGSTKPAPHVSYEENFHDYYNFRSQNNKGKRFFPYDLNISLHPILARTLGVALCIAGIIGFIALMSYSPNDPSLNVSSNVSPNNVLGKTGAVIADLLLQSFGYAAFIIPAFIISWGFQKIHQKKVHRPILHLTLFIIALTLLATAFNLLGLPTHWGVPHQLGGAVGELVQFNIARLTGLPYWFIALFAIAPSFLALNAAFAIKQDHWQQMADRLADHLTPKEHAGNRLQKSYNAVQNVLISLKSKGTALLKKQAKKKQENFERNEICSNAKWYDENHVSSHKNPHNTTQSVSHFTPMRHQAKQQNDLQKEAPACDSNAFYYDDTERLVPYSQNALESERIETTGDYDKDYSIDSTPQTADFALAPYQQESLSLDNQLETVDEIQPQPPQSLTSRNKEHHSFEQQDYSERQNSFVSQQFISQQATSQPVHYAPDTHLAPSYSSQETQRPSAPPFDAAPQQTPPKQTASHYLPPSISLFAEPDPAQLADNITSEEAWQNARTLEGVLADFGVKGEVVNANSGPVVTLYEFEPAPGTKTSRVVGLADDVARSMSALSARIAVVPGRSVIGIELPNPRRETVYYSEMLRSDSFRDTKLKLPLALGKDISGEPLSVDLAKMPHLLIAGTTGSGKSVAVNTMILSLLYRLSPEQCRFIMIDPKMLELSVYEGIPHLLCPPVIEPKKAVVALNWAVKEMERRYKAMSNIGVRNIDGYNKRVKEAANKGESLLEKVQTGFDPETGRPTFEEQEMDLSPLPYIVIIVDELADLMLVAGKEIEGALQRLAQMARAAGLHLVMATQRPSVDVITGTIKSNFPTRISFHVTSKIDSRTILGEMGAEQLLGMGDMLYMPSGSRLKRVHGPFASDEEVEQVVRYLKDLGEPDYVDSITEEENGESLEGDGHYSTDSSTYTNSGDDLFDQAVAIVIRHKKASTSFVQRQLQIGYNRAARLIEQMEERGLISSADHVGRRKILAVGNDESMDTPNE